MLRQIILQLNIIDYYIISDKFVLNCILTFFVVFIHKLQWQD
jgi:hypothetical protein